MDLKIVSTGSPTIDTLTATITIAAFFLCSTYVFTTCRYLLDSMLLKWGIGKQPVTLPYWIPFLGNALTMARDGHAFYHSIISRSAGRPIGARIGPMYVYFISGAKNIQTIFRSSKILSSDFLVLEVSKKCIGMPKEDIAIYEADTSGSFATPLTPVPEEKRIWRHMHEVQHHYLSSAGALGSLTRVFTAELERILDEIPDDGWTSVPIYNFARTTISTASTISLVGSGVFRESSTLIDDFWDYMEGFLDLFMGLPRFVNPKVWDARQRLNEACIRHLKGIGDKYAEIQKEDQDWNTELGNRVNRLRDKTLRDAGLSVEGRGAQLAGFLIGINGNAIPIAGWIMIEVIRTPGLLDRLREEVSTALLSDPKSSGTMDFDIPKLLSLPLLSSVYTETLRLRISTTITRKLLTHLEIDGLTLKKGNVIMVPSRIAHSDADWSTPEHPSTSFWAERFLSSKDSEKRAAMSTTKPGTYFPFGGGSSMCPGRFFAKQEVLTAVAMFIWKFDIEFDEYVTLDGKQSNRGPEIYKRNVGAGAVVPDRDLKVGLKRRI